MDEFPRHRANIFWYSIDLISFKIDAIAKLYEKYIGSQYEKESNFFKLKKHKKILHIGSGAYPISALTLSKNNGVKIVGIDKNLFSANIAKKVIKQKKLEEKIKIVNSDGLNYKVDDFDLIIVSGCSVPKISVLKHIFIDAKKGSRILIREGNQTIPSVMKLLDNYPNIKIIDEFNVDLNFNMSWKSFYLEKN